MRFVLYLVATVALLVAKGASGQTSPFDALAKRELQGGQRSCSTDDDCAGTRFCGSDDVCIECESDDDCGTDERCGVKGFCQDGCSSDDDCGTDKECRNHICRPEDNIRPRDRCTSSDECSSDEECSGDGECVSKSSSSDTSYLSGSKIHTCSNKDSEDSCE